MKKMTIAELEKMAPVKAESTTTVIFCIVCNSMRPASGIWKAGTILLKGQRISGWYEASHKVIIDPTEGVRFRNV